MPSQFPLNYFGPKHGWVWWLELVEDLARTAKVNKENRGWYGWGKIGLQVQDMLASPI